MVQLPKTMSPEAFSKAISVLAAECEALPIQRRAPLLRRMGDLWKQEGYDLLAESWYASADQAEQDYGKV